MIMSILSKLGPEFSFFVSRFHSGKITLRNWKMPSRENFMESLTQEQEKLVQMGSINTKDQALAVGVLNSAKEKPKSKNSKFRDNKKSEKPKSNEGATNPPKEKEKKGKEKAKGSYFHKGWHLEIPCMKNTIETIV